MKKIYLNRFLKFVALIVPIVLAVALMQDYVFVFGDGNTERIQKFYKEESNSLDVVFMGASEVHNGYSPGYAYDKYGYTSYMYSIDGNVGSLYTAQLTEILAHQKPTLIFVEIGGFMRSEDELSDEAKLRAFIDNIPNSVNKWDTIMKFDYDNKISCFFPFIKYHGDLSTARNHLYYLYRYHSILDSASLLKGMVTRTTTHPGSHNDNDGNSPSEHINETSKTYLVEFLEYCRLQNLDNVVFIRFPWSLQGENQNASQVQVEDIVQIVTEYGFDYWDIHKEQSLIGLNKTADYYDTYHLNASGQQKTTDYLGDAIINRFGLIPRAQSPKNQAHWQDCATFTEEYFSVYHDALLAGNDYFIGMDTDLLHLLDQSTAEKMRAALSRAN